MPRLKLTKSAIASIPAPDPSGKQTLHWDTELKGFAVLASGTTTAKTFVVQHTMRDGKSRRVTIGPVNVTTFDAAQGQAKGLLGQFWENIDPKAAERATREERRKQERGTLSAVLDDYLGKKKLSDNSRTYYRRMIERHLASWLPKPLADITLELVKARHAEIAKEIAKRNPGSRKGGGPTNGQGSANMVMRLFGVLWKWAARPHRLGNIGSCPTWILQDEDQWFQSVRRERLVKGDDLPRWFRAVDQLESRTQRDYLLLMLFTGLRRREAASLRWDDIDFAARLIRLPAARTKSGRRLDLPLSAYVRDLLLARRALGRDGPFVFPATSKSGHVEDAATNLDIVAKQTGIVVCAHDLRRTFITVAESSDISPMALKALVNHQLPESDVTAGYVRMTVERLREPAQRVCDRLLALCQIEQRDDVERITG
jgi:integrase